MDESSRDVAQSTSAPISLPPPPLLAPDVAPRPPRPSVVTSTAITVIVFSAISGLIALLAALVILVTLSEGIIDAAWEALGVMLAWGAVSILRIRAAAALLKMRPAARRWLLLLSLLEAFVLCMPMASDMKKYQRHETGLDDLAADLLISASIAAIVDGIPLLLLTRRRLKNALG